MCGIAGMLGGEVRPDALIASCDALRHRGPDGEATWAEPGIGLAHTRLAIIDLAGGDQPMFTADERYVVVCNGEIYNHRELRRELEGRGVRFRTNSDTEVLLHLYAREGDAMVARLRGMFAFAVVDRRDGRALLARDRFGKKPLCYAESDGTLVFASTLDALRPLLATTPEVDPGAIAAVPRAAVRAGPAHGLAGGPEAPARSPRVLAWRTPRGPALLVAADPRGRRSAHPRAGGVDRTRSRADPGRRRHPPGERGAARRVPLGRTGLLGRRGRGRRGPKPGRDVFGRVQARRVRRVALRAVGRRPVRRRTPRARGRRRRPGVVRGAHPRVRRAVRRLVGARDAGGREGGTRTRHRDLDRRRRRRAVRGLRALLRVSDGASAPPHARSAGRHRIARAGGRRPRPSERASVRRSLVGPRAVEGVSGRAVPLRAARARLVRASRGARWDRRGRTDEGARRAVGRRPGLRVHAAVGGRADLPAGRPPGEDGPRDDGALARGAFAAARPPARGVRRRPGRAESCSTAGPRARRSCARRTGTRFPPRSSSATRWASASRSPRGCASSSARSPRSSCSRTPVRSGRGCARDAVRPLVRRTLDGDDAGKWKTWNLLALAGWASERNAA